MRLKVILRVPNLPLPALIIELYGIKKERSSPAMPSQRNNIPRHLVATSDKSTWDSVNPMLFLGTWCFSPEPLIDQAEKGPVILDYHLKTPSQFLQAGTYVDDFYETLLKKLSDHLNVIHHLDWDERSWRILIGPWLHRHLEIYYDRWRNIELALEEYKLASHCLPLPSNEDLIPLNFDHLGESSKTDEWNALVYGLIMSKQGPQVCKKEVQKVSCFESNKNDAHKKDLSNQANTKSFINVLRSVLLAPPFQKLIKSITSKNRVFLYDFYTPTKFNRLLTYLYFLNLNFLLNPPTIETHKAISWDKRKKLEFAYKPDNKFEAFILESLPKMFPRAYLEDFDQILESTDHEFFPKQPKVIVTATGQWSSDLFRAWAAIKTRNGAKLLIQQHGACYGTAIYSFFEQHELKICDSYFSWGWGKSNPKIQAISAPVRRCTRKQKYQSNGKFLIICGSAGRYLSQLQSDTHYGSRAELYSLHLLKILEVVHLNNKKQVMIKLFPDEKERGKPLGPTISSRYPSAQVISKTESFSELVLSSRLCIHTYNGTPFLEGLALEHPCILVNDDNLTSVRESAKPFFTLLKNVGIYHESTASLKSFIHQNGDNIVEWWTKTDVANARATFCKEFVLSTKNHKSKLYKKIRSTVSSG